MAIKFNISSPDHPETQHVQMQRQDSRIVKLSKTFSRRRQMHPRIFHLTLGVMIPLMLLLAWGMLCGHILVLYESRPELESNDKALANFFTANMTASNFGFGQNSFDKCWSTSVEQPTATESFNMTDLKVAIDSCLAENNAITQDRRAIEDLERDLKEELTFEWNQCKPSDNVTATGRNFSGTSHDQSDFVLSEWGKSFNELKNEMLKSLEANKTMSSREKIKNATSYAIENASGMKNCKIHSAGGAIFWFTVMTTIGYGNTAPVTDEGKALVIGLGFISILGFTAVIGSAASICLLIVDDAFQRLNMHRFVDGWLASFFWLVVFAFWNMLVLVIGDVYMKNRYEVSLRKFDIFWFSFISMTTVGLGDFHIWHERFEYIDFCYIPILLLLGFVWLTNFLYKLSKAVIWKLQDIGLISSDEQSLEHLLSMSRRQILVKPSSINNKSSEENVVTNGDDKSSNSVSETTPIKQDDNDCAHGVPFYPNHVKNVSMAEDC